MIEKMNPFDPVTDADPAEGKVIAYGSYNITQSTTGWVDCEIKLMYKDTEARPADGRYSLVISCASRRLRGLPVRKHGQRALRG